MKHAVTEDELSEYIEGTRQNWSQFACSSDGKNIKRLEFCIGNVAPLYRVTWQGQCTYIGAMQETAVREYNALP